jgi:murein tripeptide amidase MpaA
MACVGWAQVRPSSGVEPPGAAAVQSLADSTKASSKELLTVAEKTGFEETGTYDEVLRLARELEQRSPWVKVQTIGKTPQGRDLLLIVVSKEKSFTAEAARRSTKPAVLIQNGIHAGEIGGKDASLMLIRDLAITKRHEALLNRANVLFIPVFNVDGHENRSPYHRINQNGPKEMGFRGTAQRLNLNRDYMKAEAPEMQAWLRVYREWLPEFFIDNHGPTGRTFNTT